MNEERANNLEKRLLNMQSKSTVEPFSPKDLSNTLREPIHSGKDSQRVVGFIPHNKLKHRTLVSIECGELYGIYRHDDIIMAQDIFGNEWTATK